VNAVPARLRRALELLYDFPRRVRDDPAAQAYRASQQAKGDSHANTEAYQKPTHQPSSTLMAEV
jgi:hypothetical protein